MIIKQTPKFVVGIDEVGRGPIAGPTAVCALLWKDREIDPPPHVKDSKQLSPQKREEWFKQIKDWEQEGRLAYAVSYVCAATIDKIGINVAIHRAICSALKRLELDPASVHILLDGGLHAPDEFYHQETIIRGDEHEPTIALASITAKVLRDRLMEKMADQYPGYGFDVHKGYGTHEHYRALRKLGPSPLHRLSFI
jgi:ribonuclease HII